jgi:integrase
MIRHLAARGAAAAKHDVGQHAKAARSSAVKPARPGPCTPSAAQPGKPRGRASPPGPLPSPAAGIRLYTPDGARKYVTAGERAAFLREAERAGRLVLTPCMTLAYAGCCLSEALALTADRSDLAAGGRRRRRQRCGAGIRGAPGRGGDRSALPVS